jgi:hypothetical protein
VSLTRTTVFALLLCACPALASAQLVSVDFTTNPPTVVDGGGSQAVSRNTTWYESTGCNGQGDGWTDSDGGSFLLLSWCDFAVSEVGDCDNTPVGETSTDCDDAGDGSFGQLTWTTGYGSGPITPVGGTWPGGTGTWYAYLRLKANTALGYSGNLNGAGDVPDAIAQMKFIQMNTGLNGGDDRTMIFLGSGNWAGFGETERVSLSLQKNICHNEAARVGLTLNTVHEVILSWKYGAIGTGFVKVWVESANEASPTADDLSINCDGVWDYDETFFDDGFNFAAIANAGTIFDNQFDLELYDFYISDTMPTLTGSNPAQGRPTFRFRTRSPGDDD